MLPLAFRVWNPERETQAGNKTLAIFYIRRPRLTTVTYFTNEPEVIFRI